MTKKIGIIYNCKFEDQEFICESDICNSINEPEEKYEYFNELTSQSVHCFIYKKMILANAHFY
ncbi:hypothetical protein BpHYR1_007711 [Brachionus plicatilis]|uniref:Uncharacterized protein n=1 Tax=Brachionus plicatilis TaxID=10195 RepID=A0A3M7PWA5_BRAPC|nr:hypothetical protein BpHYR1_007711 [Brachionus plicatilis]